MKYAYLYVVVVLALIAGGYFLFANSNQTQSPEAMGEVPEGFHRMPDGTLMRNDMGTEGMGAMEEFRQSMEEQETQPEEQMPEAVNPDAKIFEIKGTNYAYDVTEIRVQKGDTVVINFESEEGFHDWMVSEFGAATEKVQPGTPTSVTFVADEAGTFEYFCSVGDHRVKGMVGKLIVEEA